MINFKITNYDSPFSDIIDPTQKECAPYYTYRQDTLFCSCDSSGQWRADRCRKRFHQIRPRTNPYLLRIGTKISCIPDHFYIYECNICVCSASAYISLEYCTNRLCPVKHKIDPCNPGDVIRTEKELCACSNINYFVDSHCVNVTNEVIQEIKAKDLSNLIHLGNYWDNLKYTCKAFYTYILDCSTCDCASDIKLHCNHKQCEDLVDMRSLRVSKAMKAYESLPILENLNTRCTPGIKYRYRCNTCYCTDGQHPICTTMICLDEIILTEDDLRLKRRSFY